MGFPNYPHLSFVPFNHPDHFLSIARVQRSEVRVQGWKLPQIIEDANPIPCIFPGLSQACLFNDRCH
jgi:hypothetical protein